jgi:hypothetical protein
MSTEHQILLPKTRSRHNANFSIKQRALHTHYVEQINTEPLAFNYFDLTSLSLCLIFLPYIFIYLYFYNSLQKGLNMGKPIDRHPITHYKTLNNPLLGSHSPQNTLISMISTLPWCPYSTLASKSKR